MNIAVYSFSFSSTSSSDRVFVGTPAKLPRRIVADCMTTDPITLTIDTPVNDAIKILLENGISGAPVVDSRHGLSTNHVVGIVSTSDFLPREDSGVLLPMFGSVPEVEYYAQTAKKIIGQKVGDIMTSDPITIKQSETMRQASSIMSSNKLHRLLVVNSTGDLVGILTRSDVMRDVLTVSNLLLPMEKKRPADENDDAKP